MAEGEVKTEKVTIPTPYVGPVIRTLGLVKSALYPMLGFPEGGAGDETAAVQWWSKRPAGDQQRIRQVLAACASPALVFNARILAGETRMVAMSGVIDSLRPADPLYLVGDSPQPGLSEMVIVPSRELLLDTLAGYLAPGLPVGELQFKLTLSREDLRVLMGMVDVFRRARYLALLDHSVPTEDLGIEEIAGYCARASAAPDPRWILPLLLSAAGMDLPPPADTAVKASLERMVRTGVLQNGGAAGRYRFSEAGMVMYESLAEPLSLILLEVGGATREGVLATASALFVRSDPLLWFIDTGTAAGDSAMLVACSGKQARDLAAELITPVAVPVPLPSSAPAPKAPPAAAPAAPPAAPARKFCRNCGEPLAPEAKFCGKCGTSL